MEEIEIWPFEQMVFAQSRICPGEWNAQNSQRFWERNGLLNLDQTTRPSDNQQKERTRRIVDFAVLADHRVTLKENEKKDKYQDLAEELKKTMEYESDGNTNCNWCFWYSHQRINKGTWGLENKRTSGDHYWERLEYWEESWRHAEICCHSHFSEKPTANADMNNTKSK